VTIGHHPDSGISAVEGFVQVHSEHKRSSVYSSHFGGQRFLVAEFDFQEDDPAPERPWIAFVRLAAHIQRYLDLPEDDARPDDGPGVPALKPGPRGPRALSAECRSTDPQP
jgi:hypothetical protein